MVKKLEKASGQKVALTGLCRGSEAPSRWRQEGVGAEPPATENFCIFYVKKVTFSAFNCTICCIYLTHYAACKHSNALTCDNHFPVAPSGFGKERGATIGGLGAKPLAARG